MSRLSALDPAALEATLDEAAFSGVVHVAGDDDEAPLTICRGLADRANGIPNRASTRFGCASISKLVTGMTVARLVDRAALAWDATYASIAGEAWTPSAFDRSITIGQLLSHTSGFGDYFDEEGEEPYEAIWTRTPSTTIRGPTDMWPLLRGLPQVAAPGTRAVYNNGAFVLIGIALEVATGLAYPELVGREVFGPLGMERSGFWPLDDVVPDLAIGYLPPRGDGAWRANVLAIPAMGGPDGGVQATAGDLVRLLDGLAGRGGEPFSGFLSAATRAALIGPEAAGDGGFYRFGRGVLHVGEGASTRYGHTGEDPGASARAWTYPGSGERVAVVSNVTEGSGLVTRRIDALLAGG